ncbi:MAG: hypothetical protein HQL37_03330 [Alphaproteobacteria bacterium]|nr:hypothetical protein [Alphaproteobacteria bacterium]
MPIPGRVLFRVALVLTMASCLSLPQPFRHDTNNPPNSLVQLRSGLGVVVRPAKGAPESLRIPIAQAMAQSLQGDDIPAVVGNPMPADALRTIVEPMVYETRRSGQVVHITVVWTLKSGKDVPLAEESKVIAVPAWEWYEGKRATLALLVGDIGHHFAGQLMPPNETVVAPLPPLSRRTVAVTSVNGLSEDGNRALMSSMIASLKRTGFDLVPAQSADFLVVGIVTVTVGNAGTRHIAVNWTVTDHGGVSFGKATQQNDVPTELMSPPLTTLADAIAAGGAQGVAEIVDKAK